jgi:hypothetical protein
MRSLSLWRAGQLCIPLRQQTSEFVAKGDELVDPLIQLVKMLPRELPNAPAWCPAAISCGQHALKILERESHDERALNQQDTLNSGGGVATVTGGTPCHPWQQPLSLVVPERISAHSRCTRDISRSHRLPGQRLRTVV